MKKRLYRVPRDGGAFTEEQCLVVVLRLGESTHRFALQYEGGRPCVLTDYRSGMLVSRLNGAAVRRMATMGHNAFLSSRFADWRELAQEHIDLLVSQLGAPAVRAKLSEPKTLNR